MVLDLSRFDATQLALIEVLDMADAAKCEPSEFGRLMGEKASSPRKARLLYALGWVIARRAEPDLTFAEVCRWKLTVQGKPDPAVVRRNQERAQAMVNAAEISGLHPDEAGELSIAELGAYAANRKARRVRRR